MRKTIAVAVTALSLIAPTSALAQAETTTTTEKVPFFGQDFNPCNGDLVTFEGTVNFVTHLTTTPNGHFLVSQTGHFTGKGSTLSGTGIGTRYVILQTQPTHFTGDFDVMPAETTTVTRNRFISKGPAPDFYQDQVIHSTINANGETTSTVFHNTATCQGSPTLAGGPDFLSRD